MKLKFIFLNINNDSDDHSRYAITPTIIFGTESYNKTWIFGIEFIGYFVGLYKK